MKIHDKRDYNKLLLTIHYKDFIKIYKNRITEPYPVLTIDTFYFDITC